jgi:hypothetical protein
MTIGTRTKVVLLEGYVAVDAETANMHWRIGTDVYRDWIGVRGREIRKMLDAAEFERDVKLTSEIQWYIKAEI